MSEPDLRLPERFSVGDWTADPQTLSISRGNSVRTLEPRAFAVLRYLAERPLKLVKIDELLDALWAGTIVTPNAATRIIAQLRKSLGDEAKQPRYIQTVARSGYRLIASAAPVAPAAASATSGGQAMMIRPRKTWLRRGGMAAALLSVIAVLAWRALFPDAHPDASIAVLPFENYTGDATLDYLGDGVAEEVISSLTQVPNLEVTARDRSFRFHGGEEGRESARRLGVAFLVDGSVRLSGERLRITAQLVSTESGSHLWSNTAEHDMDELFAAQDAISSGVAGALADILNLQLGAPTNRVHAVPDPEAYDLYLRGRYVWHRRGSEPLQPAIDALSEVVRIDPEFARGWAALASAYLTHPSYSPAGRATWHLAEEAAKRALELDPDIPEVYGVLGTFAETRLQWAQAHEMFAEGVRRDDNSATAHYWYSEHLAKMGRFRDSRIHLQRAMSLDPLYTAPQVDAGFSHLMFGDSEAAAEQFARLLAAGMDSPASWTGRFISFILTGDDTQARRMIEADSFPPAQRNVLLRYIDFEANGGDAAALAAEVFADPQLQPGDQLVIWFASRLGAYDQVIAFVQARLRSNQYVDPRPLWGPGTKLSEAANFVELVEEMGLTNYWETVAWGDFCRPGSEQIVCNASALAGADRSRGQ